MTHGSVCPWSTYLPRSRESGTSSLGVKVTQAPEGQSHPTPSDLSAATVVGCTGWRGTRGLSEQDCAFHLPWGCPTCPPPHLHAAPLVFWGGSCYRRHLTVQWARVSFCMFMTQQTCQITARALASSCGLLLFFKYYIVWYLIAL